MYMAFNSLKLFGVLKHYIFLRKKGAAGPKNIPKEETEEGIRAELRPLSLPHLTTHTLKMPGEMLGIRS